jgi:hypothetical protein
VKRSAAGGDCADLRSPPDPKAVSSPGFTLITTLLQVNGGGEPPLERQGWVSGPGTSMERRIASADCVVATDAHGGRGAGRANGTESLPVMDIVADHEATKARAMYRLACCFVMPSVASDPG